MKLSPAAIEHNARFEREQAAEREKYRAMAICRRMGCRYRGDRLTGKGYWRHFCGKKDPRP
jgi:hypothetical protein